VYYYIYNRWCSFYIFFLFFRLLSNITIFIKSFNMFLLMFSKVLEEK
jgi:hypothetical protein